LIFSHLDVFENAAFPLRARRVAKSAVRDRVAWALALAISPVTIRGSFQAGSNSASRSRV